MNNCICGTIDSARVLEFETASVYEGENNSSVLKIDTSHWEEGEVDFFTLAFETAPCGEKFYSNIISGPHDTPACLDGGYIYCPVTSAMTRTGRLGVQVRAHKTGSDGEEATEKTSVSFITLSPSINGGELLPEQEESLLYEIGRLSGKVALIEQALSVIPVASSTGVGGMMIDSRSPIRLENRTARMNYEGVDFDYFCASLTAKFLYSDVETTPVYFPSSAAAAQTLISDIYESCAEGVRYMIVVPGTANEKASLVTVENTGGTVTAGAYSAGGLLGLLRGE